MYRYNEKGRIYLCRGFGLRRTNHLEGRAAYLSAAATAQRVMAAGPAPFQPFEGPKGAQLSQQWETLHDVADGLCEADERTTDATNMPTIARGQGTFGRHMAQCQSTALKRFWNPSMQPP
jgi:hypothetical protein